MLDEVYRKALALKIVEVTEACPGDCGKEEKIEFIKSQFPDFKPDEITKKLKGVKHQNIRTAPAKNQSNALSLIFGQDAIKIKEIIRIEK